MFEITSQAIDIQSVIDYTSHDTAGAVNVFIGTVRSHSFGKNVIKLEYEAFDSMAIKKMKELVAQASEKWPIKKAAIVHRKGELQIGEVAVAMAVACPHRAEAFAACQWLIDNLKQVVPIWKKEHYTDGAVWVAAHA
jgi:molybdopterin synthase catalytic subunit